MTEVAVQTGLKCCLAVPASQKTPKSSHKPNNSKVRHSWIYSTLGQAVYPTRGAGTWQRRDKVELAPRDNPQEKSCKH